MRGEVSRAAGSRKHRCGVGCFRLLATRLTSTPACGRRAGRPGCDSLRASSRTSCLRVDLSVLIVEMDPWARSRLSSDLIHPHRDRRGANTLSPLLRSSVVIPLSPRASGDSRRLNHGAAPSADPASSLSAPDCARDHGDGNEDLPYSVSTDPGSDAVISSGRRARRTARPRPWSA